MHENITSDRCHARMTKNVGAYSLSCIAGSALNSFGRFCGQKFAETDSKLDAKAKESNSLNRNESLTTQGFNKTTESSSINFFGYLNLN